MNFKYKYPMRRRMEQEQETTIFIDDFMINYGKSMQNCINPQTPEASPIYFLIYQQVTTPKNSSPINRFYGAKMP